MRHAHAHPQGAAFFGPPWLAMAGRGHHHGHGRGPWRGAWPGRGPFDFAGFGRGPRARRGDVRAALLVLLAEEPRNGYQLIQEIEQRSGGLWKPSPGSVYPALQQLEDEGLVRTEEVDGRRTFRLTDEGQAYVEQHRDEFGAPWEAVSGGFDPAFVELRDLVGQVAAATIQVARAGTAAQIDEAKKILADARRALYRLLAEDAPEGGAPREV